MWNGTASVLGLFARLVRGLLAVGALGTLLAAVPWALTHFVGWPLPDHLPSWAEIQSVLFGPMTSTFLVALLTCLSWLVWAFFTLDVARCAIDIACDTRMPDLSAAGPVRRIAAVLVGGVLISLLGQRAGLSATSSVTGTAPSEVVATATPWSTPSDQTVFAIARRSAYDVQTRRETPAAAPERTGRAKSAVVLPYNPVTGVHDSLWRMAERTLGDGSRWPEIYALNQGKPQPGDTTLTRPSLIYPGEEMALPDDATVGSTPPTTPVTPPPPPHSATAPVLPPATGNPQPTQAPTTTQAPSTNAPGEPGFRWSKEPFVGLGLVAAISAAVVITRRRNRSHYRPGSGDRSDLLLAPTVYRLRLAYLRAEQDDIDADDEVDLDRPGTRPPRAWAQPVALGARDDQTPVLPIGVRDGREIALHLAAARGLGFLGAGASAALRALLVTILSAPGETADRAVTVVVPAADLAALLGARAARTPLPAVLHVVADFDAALDALESETLVRIGQLHHVMSAWGPVVLVARTPERQAKRLQAVLDNGSTVGVTGLLLGQWNPGVTAYVRGDGTISTTSPGLGEPLRGARVFQLGDDHTADLLTLLRNAHRNDTSGEPAADASLELPTVEGETPRQRGGDLEILGSSPTTSTGLRPRSSYSRMEQADQTVDGNRKRGKAAGKEPQGPADRVDAPLRVSVLGPPRVWWRAAPASPGVERDEVDITSAFQPRLRELLVFLALHPDGVSREALIAALWPTSPQERTTNAMNTSLSRLRRTLAAATHSMLSDVVLVGESRYLLDPDLVEIDYHHFAAAVSARRAATIDADRVEAYRRIVDSYTGPLADGLSTEWIETAREAIRRDAIDAVAALARALVEHDPQQTLDLLEIARAFDPHNELIYRDIMRLQERLGQHDAIPRTLTLLTTRLAEVDDRPTQQAVDLAERLRHRSTAADEPGPTNYREHSRVE